MQITITSTECLTRVDGVLVRVWEGTTAQGLPCRVLVHRLLAAATGDPAAFAAEVQATLPPGQLVDVREIL